MFLMPSAGVSTGSHQALAGSTGAHRETTLGAGWMLKIPPNFSFARVSGAERGSGREDRWDACRV